MPHFARKNLLKHSLLKKNHHDHFFCWMKPEPSFPALTNTFRRWLTSFPTCNPHLRFFPHSYTNKNKFPEVQQYRATISQFQTKFSAMQTNLHVLFNPSQLKIIKQPTTIRLIMFVLCRFLVIKPNNLYANWANEEHSWVCTSLRNWGNVVLRPSAVFLRQMSSFACLQKTPIFFGEFRV